MISIAEALEAVLGGCAALDPVEIAIDDALGCVLAEPVVADEASPPFANSAMDGYAVHAADTADAPVTLAVVGTVLAGQHRSEPVGRSEAVRIMTGAPMPPGVDAVCLVERTHSADDGATVVIEITVTPGTAMRLRGDDIEVGDTVFETGTQVRPAHIGVLSGLGVTRVRAFPKVRVGVLSTGDELTSSTGPLGPGQIRDSNRHSLLALVRDQGFEPVDLGIVGDDEARLSAIFRDVGERCDAVLTTGGVSVGDRDVVKDVLRELSDDAMRWMQVAVKPAKPLAFGVLARSGVPVFGLPGNPVSCMVSFELFARPGLRRLAGHAEVARPALPAFADADFGRGLDGKTHLVTAIAGVGADGRLHVRPSGGQGSHRLRTLADANALVLLPDGPGAVVGDEVTIWLLADPNARRFESGAGLLFERDGDTVTAGTDRP